MEPRAGNLFSSTKAMAGLLLAVVALLLGMTATAQAAGPHWTMTMSHAQEPLTKGNQPMLRGVYNAWTVSMVNTGNQASTGMLTFTDHLPPGVTLTSIGGAATPSNPVIGQFFECSTSIEEVNNGAPLVCQEEPEPGSFYDEPAGPGGGYNITLTVDLPANSPSEVTNSATLTEGGVGGAPEASVSETNEVKDVPPFRVREFEARTTDPTEAGYTVAGGHPYQTLNRWVFPQYPDEQMRNAFVTLPPGYIGNPAAAPRCPIGNIGIYFSNCPPGSEIGSAGIGFLGGYGEGHFPIFNVVPDKGFSAQFVFNVLGNQISLYVIPLPRTESYGLAIGSTNAAHVDIKVFSATFFGVPSEHGSGASGAPFLTNPVDCAEAEPSWKLTVDTWENPGVSLPDGLPDLSDPTWLTATEPTPPVTGCDDPALASQFQPSIDVKPVQEGAGTQADQPTGLTTDLHFPQTNDPTDLDTVFNSALPQSPEPKDITVKLPAGVSISPSSAEGLEGCSDSAADPAGDQVHYDNTVPVDCPNGSIVGTAVADSPLLASRDPVDDKVTGAEPIHGTVYLLKSHPGDLSPSGDQDGTFRVLLQLENPRYGVNFKLPGTITADKTTGQLTARFAENPQLPVSQLELSFKSGPRAPLATPITCGSFETTSDMVPWSTPGTPDATPSSSFDVDSGPNGTPCADTPAARPFSPTLSAGTESTAPGQSSPFVLNLSRNDGEQEFNTVELTTPKGFTASLKGIPYCSDAALATAASHSGAAELASASCPAASQVGTLTAAAGSGTNPFNTSGKAYLAGPYKGAPLSIALITPAVAGPFDLGDIVVRAALHLDPETTQVTIKADPIPQILDGVPLRIHSIAVSIDRPGFAINPTNCAAQAVTATLGGSSGASVSSSKGFRVAGCDQLGFAPKLALSLKGSTKRTGNPALSATVSFPQGAFANISTAAVSLPDSELLDNNHIVGVCTKVQYAAKQCPAGSIYGFAKATTPLLDGTLEGPVYLRSAAEGLPNLVADLDGQIHVDLVGKIDTTKNGGIRNTFEAVPDVPVTSFTLNLDGGKKGLLENSINLCSKPLHAIANFTGQNGKIHNIKPKVKASCKKAQKRPKRHHRRHHR